MWTGRNRNQPKEFENKRLKIVGKKEKKEMIIASYAMNSTRRRMSYCSWHLGKI